MQTFNEVQKLLSKTNGKLVGDLMTPAPVVVRESTNLEDAARFSHSLSDIIVLLFSVFRLLANKDTAAFVSFKIIPSEPMYLNLNTLFDVSDYC